MNRTARDVVEDHLDCRTRGDLEADLRRNYAPEAVLMSAEGVHHGHDGVRKLDEVLHVYLPDLQFRIERLLVHERFAWLEWTGTSQDARSHRSGHDGVDTFVVEAGRVVAQTIHFSVTRP